MASGSDHVKTDFLGMLEKRNGAVNIISRSTNCGLRSSDHRNMTVRYTNGKCYRPRTTGQEIEKLRLENDDQVWRIGRKVEKALISVHYAWKGSTVLRKNSWMKLTSLQGHVEGTKTRSIKLETELGPQTWTSLINCSPLENQLENWRLMLDCVIGSTRLRALMSTFKGSLHEVKEKPVK